MCLLHDSIYLLMGMHDVMLCHSLYLISDLLVACTGQTLSINWCFQLDLAFLHPGCFCIALSSTYNSVINVEILRPFEHVKFMKL